MFEEQMRVFIKQLEVSVVDIRAGEQTTFFQTGKKTDGIALAD